MTILHMPTSPDTVLRMIRSSQVGSPINPRIIGVDDFSFRRGKTFGTILVDLERHRVVDLVPDRSGDTLAAWLKEHPGISIIARDRSGEYARGATEGAPQAKQVADRWHLVKNLGDGLQQWFERHRNELFELQTVNTQAEQVFQEPQLSRFAKNGYERILLERLEKRARRKRLYQRAKDLKEQGFSINAIAKKLAKGRSTVRRLLNQQGERKPRVSRLEPFIPYLNKRWEQGLTNRKQLYREIQTQGFTDTYSVVCCYFAARNAGLEAAFPRPNSGKYQARQQNYTPSQGRGLFTQRKSELEPGDQARLQGLFTQLPEARPCYELSQEFLELVRHPNKDKKAVPALNRWLKRALSCPVAELRRFAQRIIPDKPAVEAALTLPWSNGQTEGQITKLKLIKRTAYGRANFDLLRKRVLLA